MMERKDIYKIIENERAYQDKKWKGTKSGAKAGFGSLDRSIDEFVLYLEVYSRDAANVAAKTSDKIPILDIVRKIAALSVACMEAHGAVDRVNN